MATLSLCLIVKDEEHNLAPCLDSIRGQVDEVIVVDTGSRDRTREIAIRYGASVYQFDHINHPEAFFFDDEATCKEFGGPGPYSGDWALGDFAAARNESFRHAKGDYVVWIDADDVLEDPDRLRGVVADMEQRRLDIGFLAYNYAQDHLGRVFYRQWRERVFRRNLGSWINPVHEVYMPTKPTNALCRYDHPVYSHKRKADRKGVPHRNYKILLRQAWQLKKAHPDKPLDPRILFYLGQEARFVDPAKAIGFYEEYLQGSGWPEERAAAHCAVGNLLEYGTINIPAAQAYAQADREYATAAAEMPNNPDGLLGMARIAYLRGRWQDCVNYTERGLSIGNTDTMLGTNPMDRLYRPHVFYSHALSKLGRLEEAIKSCESGLSVCGDDPGVPGGAPGMLKHNLKAFRDELARRTPAAQKGPNDMVTFDKNEDVDAPPASGIPRDALVIWSMQLWKQIVASGDYEKAQRFLESLPSTVTTDPVIDRMFKSTAQRGKRSAAVGPALHPSVVFYLGPGPEPWDPTTPNKKGIGGSETAAIEMAKNLAALGYAVKVYAEASGNWDGVEYIHHSNFRGAICDVFISSRAPWAVEQFGGVNANLKLLWVHDIHCGPNEPNIQRWLYQYDRILCLSEWHKGFFLQCYPSVYQDTVIVTRNGIDPARFSDAVQKENRMVFSSSPNRGLPTLLHNLEYIKQRVPDVHLDIFYGFDTWETMARNRGATQELEEIEKYKRGIEEAVKRGGVTFHGKRPQQEIAKAYLRAKVWGYPTEFPETSCITAMEAMAAGCVPVCTRFAALGETVKHGVLIDPGPGYGEKFVNECVRLLIDESYRIPLAQDGRRWAMESLSWSHLALEWAGMFQYLKSEIAANPVPVWRSAS